MGHILKLGVNYHQPSFKNSKPLISKNFSQIFLTVLSPLLKY